MILNILEYFLKYHIFTSSRDIILLIKIQNTILLNLLEYNLKIKMSQTENNEEIILGNYKIGNSLIT